MAADNNAVPSTNKVSIETLKRLHPEIQNVQEPWSRITILMEERDKDYDGPAFFVPLPNEKFSAIARRKIQFKMGFINPTLDIIRSKGDAIFKKAPTRKTMDPIALEFLESADKSGRSMDEIMHNEVLPELAAKGTCFLVIDKPSTQVISLEEQKTQGIIPYMYMIDALSVINFDWDASGKLLWFRYKYDMPSPRTSPFTDEAPCIKGYVTWTQTNYMFHDDKGNERVNTPHSYGRVPVVIQSTILSPNKTIGNSTFFTSSRYIIAGNNLNSIANNEIGKSASAILLINRNDLNETAIDRDDDTAKGSVRMTQAAADVEDMLPVVDIEKNAPSYLTKDMASVLLANEAADKYFKLAIDNENSVKSVSNLSVPQSGVAKAYDLQEVDAMLFNLARAAESAEKQIADIVGMMIGMPTDEPAYTVQYPVTFDIRSFADKMQMLKDLQAINYPSSTAITLAQKSLATDITMDPDELEEIYAELDLAEELTETPEVVALETKEETDDKSESLDEEQDEIDSVNNTKEGVTNDE